MANRTHGPEWVVRIVADLRLRSDQEMTSGPLLECLRCAGLLTKHRDDEKNVVFDLHAPRDIPRSSTYDWAKRNAEQMKTFGINAVPAPKWNAGEALPKGA